MSGPTEECWNRLTNNQLWVSLWALISKLCPWDLLLDQPRGRARDAGGRQDGTGIQTGGFQREMTRQGNRLHIPNQVGESKVRVSQEELPLHLPQVQ